MALSNYGKSAFLSAFLRGCHPGSNTAGDAAQRGFVLDGSSRPCSAIILLTSAFNFTGFSGRQNPDLVTVAQLEGSAPGCVINPSGNYTGHLHPMLPEYWVIAQDDTGDLSEATFDPTRLPLLTAIANIPNIRGYALAIANNVTSAQVWNVVHLNQTYSVATNQQFNLTNFGLSIL